MKDKSTASPAVIQREPLTEKLLEFVFSTKIKAISYFPEIDMVSLGFKDGKIENFMLLIESETPTALDSGKLGGQKWKSQTGDGNDRSSNVNLLVTKNF